MFHFLFRPHKSMEKINVYWAEMTNIWVEVDIDSRVLREITNWSIFGYSSRTPSMGPRGAEGILLMRIEAFPFKRSRERREMAWLQTSLSSCPVCLAVACAIFFTSFTAEQLNPQKCLTSWCIELAIEWGRYVYFSTSIQSHSNPPTLSSPALHPLHPSQMVFCLQHRLPRKQVLSSFNSTQETMLFFISFDPLTHLQCHQNKFTNQMSVDVVAVSEKTLVD